MFDKKELEYIKEAIYDKIEILKEEFHDTSFYRSDDEIDKDITIYKDILNRIG